MSPVNLIFELVTVLVAMALVLLLAFVSIRFLKKVQSGAPTADEIRFVRALPLGSRERAAVVIWRDEVLLLGVATGGITVLDRRPRTAEEIAADKARLEQTKTAQATGWQAGLIKLTRRESLRPPKGKGKGKGH